MDALPSEVSPHQPRPDLAISPFVLVMFLLKLATARELSMGQDRGMADLRPASPTEIEETLSFALRYSGKRRVRDADGVMARLTAERLVQHLQQSGFVLMKRGSAAAPNANLHPHPHQT